jgi:beta-glucosidase
MLPYRPRFSRIVVAALLGLVAALYGVASSADPETTLPVPREGGWLKRHEAINERAKKGDVDLLFLGDSITEGWGENKVWKEHYAGRKAMNAGIGGDRTQHVLWRLDNGNVEGLTPKAVVLMIGTNNAGSDKSADIAAGVKAIVEKLRKKLPDAKIVLLAIFPRGKNDLDAARRTNDGANEIIAGYDDGEHVFFRDLGPEFLEPDGSLSTEVMPDLLHLSERGYKIWADGIEADLVRILGEKPAK